jgi:short subunit dehydrogenase-like uncharacterized protein
MSNPGKPSERDFDLIVFGASGFTGRLVAEYLHQRYASDKSLRWAVAGRNEARTGQALVSVGIPAGAVPVLPADSNSEDSLNAIAARAKVILTTVGPYARYGSGLVAACVRHGTAYCDLAGEVQWMRKMIDLHQRDAAASGARIVHSCGFDSIPSDIGVWHLQQESNARFGQAAERVSLVVRAMRGGFSGGTAASLLNAVEEGRKSRDVARILTDPYALNPADERQGPDGRDQSGTRFDADHGVWTSPFVMAAINTRIVRRSNALLGYPYGKEFRYAEATATGPGLSGRLKATAASSAVRAFMLASAFEGSRRYLLKPLLPDPGEGPDRNARESGYFKLMLAGTTPGGDSLRVQVTGDRDPGYGSTSKMIAESAVCLAKDSLTVGGGFWTPASAMGEPLLGRLRANAGVQFDVQ